MILSDALWFKWSEENGTHDYINIHCMEVIE